MNNQALLGFVLHQSATGETSSFVTFFTREKGLIKAKVRGGRTPKMQATLQPFLPLWLYFSENAGFYSIQQIEISSLSFRLKGDYLFAGLYLNELLFHVLQPFQEEAALFEDYQKTLQSLSQHNELILESVLRRFEWKLLETLGVLISFSHEGDGCTPIGADKFYQLNPTSGFMQTIEGIKGKWILAMFEQRFDHPEVLKAAKFIMRRLLDHVLDGKIIRSRELYCS